MNLTKAFGLAALAVVAAMAFIGTGSAAAQHQVVLCKALETLCKVGNLWPSGTEILALATNAELKGTLPIVCEDVAFAAKITSAGGIGSPLTLAITSLAYGVLPTPTLGAGCISAPCGAGIQVHVNELPFAVLLAVTAVDKYTFNYVGKATMLCSGFTCGYAADKADIAPITHTGKHPLHAGENLPKIESDFTLSRTLGLAFFCGDTTLWAANYVVYLAHSGANTGLAWPALDIA
jgi:hypothetical protein